jgi:hypothetical protein
MTAWEGSGGGDASEDGNAGGAEDVFDDGFAETRGIIIEMEEIGFFVDAEFLEAVGIGEVAEGAELFRAERTLEFVGDGHECHAGKYSIEEAGN